MKKKGLLLLIVLFVSLGLFGCTDSTPAEVSAIIVSGEARVAMGTSTIYTAEVVPDNAEDKQVTWSIVNQTGEATINESGVITPVKEGTIKVVAKATNGVEGFKNVTIIAGKIPVETVTIVGPNSLNLNQDGIYIAQVTPMDATDPSVEWSVVPGTGSATITQTGNLTPQTEGTVTVVAIADGVSDEFQVMINPAVIPVEDIEIVAPEEIFEFDEKLLSYNVIPSNATYQTVSWTVINGTGSATISPAGYLIAIKPGTITVRITIDSKVHEETLEILNLPSQVTDFVYSKDGYFFEGTSNEPFRFLGTNNYTLHYKSDAMIDDAVKQAADMGIKVIRMWSFFDGWEDEGRANYAYGQLRPGVYDKTPYEEYGEILYDRNTGARRDPVNILERVDYTIRRASQYGIRVVLVMTNYYPEFGGMETYVKWYNTLNSATLTKSAFYTNETIKGWYKDWLNHVTNRVNSYTGLTYKDDPTIFAWELANEPDGGGVVAWATEMSAYLKETLQVQQMVAVGAQGSLGNVPDNLVINKDTAEGRIAADDDFNYTFTRSGIGTNGYGYGTSVNHWGLLQIPTVDYVTAHLYPDHWGIDKNYAVEYGEKFIKDHVAVAKYWAKPFVLEEYGVMRSTMSESKQIHRDLAFDVWNNALYSMGGSGSMFWILTGLEDSPDADADGNYPDFDGFRIQNDGGSTATLLKQYAKLYRGEITEISRQSEVHMLSPLASIITKDANYKVEAKVLPLDKAVDKVYLYINGQQPKEMTARPEDAYRTGIYDYTLKMTDISPGEQYTIKIVVQFTDGSSVETRPRNVRRYIYLELDNLYSIDFNAIQTVNFQTFGSYEATLKKISHNKQLEMLELDVQNKNVNWSEHKVKLIAFPPTSYGLPMIPNTFRLQYTTYYNKAIVDALPNSGSGTLKNYIALEPGWVKTGIDQNNVTINTIKANAAKEDTDPTKRTDIGVRWIDLNKDSVETAEELFYFHTLTIEFIPNDTLNAVAINPTTGSLPYEGIMYIDDVKLFGYAQGAPIDSLEPDPDFVFNFGD